MKHVSKYICSLILLFSPIGVRSQIAELDSILSRLEFKTDTVKAIFDFVASEIEYDTESSELVKPPGRFNHSTEAIVLKTLRSKKGVCEHYAELFNALLKRAGYESYVVAGYVKGPSKINDKISHAWNAVRVKNEWYLYDPTWSSGRTGNRIFEKNLNDTWYKIQPEEFIITHIPFDPIWQLLNPPVSHYQVERNDFSTDQKERYSFKDSIATDRTRPIIVAYATRIARIRKAGITNRLLEEYVAMLEYNLISEKLNAINNSLNGVVVQYNTYITAKNKRFKKPKWTDSQLQNTIDLMKSQFQISVAKLDLITTREPEINRYIADLKLRINDLERSVNSEAEFVERYLATSKLMRVSRFNGR